MKISNEMIAQIKEFEGCVLTAYLDSKGVPTIGIGHTGPDVTLGDKISDEECNRLFRADIASAEKQVNALNDALYANTKLSLSQNQFDALVDLVYNAGGATIKRGNTINGILFSTGPNDNARIIKAFMLWVKVTMPDGKKVVLGGKDGKHGLVLRRAIEAAWYSFGSDWKSELKKRQIIDVVEWARN